MAAGESRVRRFPALTDGAPVTAEEAVRFERELARELSTGHVLKGLNLRVVQQRVDRDDVAFVLEDGRLCIVHLAWHVETDARWPHTEFVTDLIDPDDETEDR
jgi:hypothetical protein